MQINKAGLHVRSFVQPSQIPLQGMKRLTGNEALSSNLVLVVDDDWNWLVDPVEHVAIDIGYEPLEPCGGDKKEGQISRLVIMGM